ARVKDFPAEPAAATTELSSRPVRSVVEGPAVLIHSQGSLAVPRPKMARGRPQQPQSNALPDRLHFGTGKINGTVQRFQHLNGSDAWIRVPQGSFVRGIDSILIGQIFNRMTQNL
ncbi:MAG TPA: hypothetical protein VN828_18820, partial [Acidobacteriaceae bacterium]|nr:hypothetical protein [Acidobacteriaceae bacterium]